ncbi:hypothetical protein [Cohnella rhizosphaerae]|uniref:Uncharacterized protein n=1 Tax=Cohnella rhizosphaerae TaxID=1457232 RepID=A0A9X4QSA5_9BACL|nr:hypothetical protein [Cohnella rhizosphaerae]MDG0809099.1 hypothetical protein [Cohnella rhizosphaerae]
MFTKRLNAVTSRWIRIAVVLSLLCSWAAGMNPAWADERADPGAYEIAVEGEDAAAHNFTDVLEGSLFSGGKLLRLETSQEAPAGGYEAVYSLHAEEAGGL